MQGETVKFTRYCCQTLIKLELSRQSLEKYSHIKFNKNRSSGRRVVPCRLVNGQRERRTDMTKLPEILLTRLKAVMKGLRHHERARKFSY